MFKLENLYVEDKHLARMLQSLAGVALPGFTPVPVVNATKKNGKLHAVTNGELVSMFQKYVKDKKLASVTAKIVKEFMAEVGSSRHSYGYVLKKAIAAGFLKKVGKGTKSHYNVVH